ncbi:hypothetical protein HN51_012842, partial [Arachis hypogaea]
MKLSTNIGLDLEDGKLGKRSDKSLRTRRLPKPHNQPFFSCLAYCLSSCSMILVNKFVLSNYDFNAGVSLMFYQSLISVIVVSVLDLLEFNMF